jgi:hypothetical protein
VNQSTVGQALEFIVDLNRSRRKSPTSIPTAAEGCFSIAEHLACVQQRVSRLQTIERQSEVDRLAASFITNELAPMWDQCQTAILSATRVEHFEQLPWDERCLSPSDFGFHNALYRSDGNLRFFDFEHAGWDDPAKMICDFFCQPQIPVGIRFWDQFANTLAETIGDGGRVAARAQRLLPAYQIKWCCIMLNDFLRTEQLRRVFALGGAAIEDRKRAQLAKAMEALKRIQLE